MTSAPNSNDELFAHLDAALPIDDLVGWLLQQYSSASEHDIKRLLTVIYQRDYHIAPADSVEKRYEVAGNVWDACPQRIERAR
jgi:hypothetical protein